VRPGRFDSDQFHAPLGVIEDALPDAWGRQLMRFSSRFALSDPHLLGLLGEDGLGALRFEPRGQKDRALPKVNRELALEDLAIAAERFERHEPLNDSLLRRLLAAGRTPGGARPKALVKSESICWIAKFPSAVMDGGFDVVGLEAATLDAAEQAGLVIPPRRLVRIGERRVLLVQRFDVLGADGSGRAHLVSMKTACGERPGAWANSYAEVGHALRRASHQTAVDLAQFYRLMVFNAVVGNTDDHTKNVWIGDAGKGWRLAPAFDLLPDIGSRREHALAFHLSSDPPSRAELMQVAKSLGVGGAAAIVDEVADAVLEGWQPAAAARGVPPAQIERFSLDMQQRIDRTVAMGSAAKSTAGPSPTTDSPPSSSPR
jgi:serine/threonine-protein kinase HipA